jgi:hypothetical protein
MDSKNYSWKFFINFLTKKIAIYLSLGLPKVAQATEKPLALKREHPALQNMKILFLFCG